MKHQKNKTYLRERAYEVASECLQNAKISGKVYMLLVLGETLLMSYYATGGKESFLKQLGGWEINGFCYLWPTIPFVTVLVAYFIKKGDGTVGGLLAFWLIMLNTILGHVFLSIICSASLKAYRE